MTGVDSSTGSRVHPDLCKLLAASCILLIAVAWALPCAAHNIHNASKNVCELPEGIKLGPKQTGSDWINHVNLPCTPSWPAHDSILHEIARGCLAHDQLCLAHQQSQGALYSVQRWRGAACPSNGRLDPLGGQGKCSAGMDPLRNLNQCPVAGNPVSLASGNKFQREVDYPGTAPTVAGERFLVFERHYNSEATVGQSSLGLNWRHSFDRSLVLSASGSVATLQRADGSVHHFKSRGTAWAGERDEVGALTGSAAAGWMFRAPSGELERYDGAGRLVSVAGPGNLAQRLHYDEDGDATTLDRVEDPFGRALVFGYQTAGGTTRLVRVTLPDAGEIRFGHSAAGQLTEVRLPGAAGEVLVRRYHYEQADLPRALTGITDERGVRYATYAYDAQGRAILTEHAGGAQRVRIEYLADGSVVERRQLDASGREQRRTHRFELRHGVRRLVGTEGACPSCGAQAREQVWNTSDRLASRTDFNGNRTLLAHDGFGRETCRIDGIPAAGSTAPAAYRKRVRTYHADAERRAPLTETVYAPGTGFTAPTTCSATSHTGWQAARSIINAYVPNQRERLRSRTERDAAAGSRSDRVTRWTYWGESAEDPPVLAGLVKQVDRPRSGTNFSDVTRYFYATTTDAAHRVGDLVRVEQALTPTNFLATHIDRHDTNGRTLSIRDANGTVTELDWHPRGWLLARRVDGQTTRFGYDATGRLTRLTLPTGEAVQYAHDAAGRLVEVRDGSGHRIEWTLDLSGNRTIERVYDEAGTLRRQVESVYDALDRLTRVIEGEGQTTHFSHDANGNVMRTVDPRDPTPAAPTLYTQNLYDALNPVRAVRDAAGQSTTAVHDLFDRPLSVTDPRGLVTSYAYNGFGERVRQTSPDTGVTTWRYDAAGNRNQQVDARNVVVNYSHDALNRLTKVDYPTDTDITLSYDETATGGPGAKGRLTTMVDAAGTTKYRYDKRGNVIRKEVTLGGVSYVTQYAYDGADRLTQMTYPSGMVVDYARDASGRIARIMADIGTGAATVIDDVGYAPFGPASTGRYGNGLPLARAYDSAGRLRSVNWGSAGQLHYTYDASGNVLGVGRGAGAAGTRHAYDALNRLRQTVLGYGWYLEYDYDATGNRTNLQLVDHGDVFNDESVYESGSNRLSSRGGVGYAYDAAGLLSEYAHPLRPEVFTHGEDQRLTHWAKLQGGAEVLTMDYAHNGLGQRVQAEMGGAWSQGWVSRGRGLQHWHYDEAGHLVAMHGMDGPLYEFIYLGDEPVGYVGHGGRDGGGAGTLHFIHTDGNGLPVRATDGSGAVVFELTTEDAFKPQASASSEVSWLPLRYPGQVEDRMTGYYYNYFRDYDPNVGRYIQSDPIGLAGGLNTYAYVSNNPLRWVDPLGLVQMCIEASLQ
jgi:RHS repeat-associated protein